MTTNIRRRHLHQFLPTASTDTVCSWERCMRRKCNDGSGLPIVGFVMPKSEIGRFNSFPQRSWDSMPPILLSPRGSLSVEKNESKELGNEKIDLPAKSFSQASKSRVLSLRQGSGTKPVSLHSNTMPTRATMDQALQSQCGGGACKNVSSNKRLHARMSEEDLCSDVVTSHEIMTLREALKNERRILKRLHKDLEEERFASAAAANEAMIMIRRLQEEKSTVLVESRHYRLASEEKDAHDEEAILLLKEALSVMENEVISLQQHVEIYRHMISKAKYNSGKQVLGLEEDEKLLLLEGNQSSTCDVENTSEHAHSEIQIADVTEEQALADLSRWPHYQCEVMPQNRKDFEATWSEDGVLDVKTDDTCGTQHLEDISLSILDRVTRLEERFARLGHNQVVEFERCDQAFDDMTRSQSKSKAAIDTGQNLHLHGNQRFMKDLSYDNSQDTVALKHEELDNVNLNSEEDKQEHVHPMLEKAYILERSMANPGEVAHEPTFMEVRDMEADGVHDVFEVPCDPNSCHMPSDLESCRTSVSSINGINDSSKVLGDKVVEETLPSMVKTEVSYHFAEDCPGPSPMSSQQIKEGRSDRLEAMKSFRASEDVQNLKLRLQALEGERAFMKVALDSLRKENMELKLLQEIAQQLRELKGDVYKTGLERSGCQKLLAFLSSLKGILSFPGLRSGLTRETSRFFCPYQERSSNLSSCEERGQAGLFSLLKYHQEEERPIRVMRECKVKLSSMISVANDCHS